MIEEFMAMLPALGYLGAFISGFFSTFTLFLPSPTFIVVFALAATQEFNPLLLGVLGGLGAAVGEMIGYGIGYGAGMGAHKVKKRKWDKKRAYVERLFKKYQPNLIIFIFSAAPILPFDLVGLFCGSIKYNYKHFIIYLTAGKILKYVLLAYMGFYGIEWFLAIF
ncbi:hypothetical protein CL614_00465 [archaeon]|nr:hypothetical protein [archaeon]|tara:strand:+ start:1610 stop:2104 length:495 start_codon:yes stop_codon:yes gene_type:complete